MKLTQEQQKIINSTGNIKINAVAGSGKTTTIIEYARTRPENSRILYLAFNRSVRVEAKNKFTEKALNNVQIETAHSLAYKNIVFKHEYKVRSQSYLTHEVVEILDLKGNKEKHTEYILAKHINNFVAYFCNSNKQKVKELNYLDIVTEAQAKIFVENFYGYIEKQSRIFLGKMNTGEIDITHDFYLKKFQLENPILDFDYILFDEGQDASPAMLDIFLKQKATKVIVGDTHQQIYGWRHAINSLEQVDFKILYLSKSFRFGQEIADLGVKILDWKKYINNHATVKITGSSRTPDKNKSQAILARTNLSLLIKAIEYTAQHPKIQKIYFEGNLNSYTYADEGASLYDVLNLYTNKQHLIRDKLIKSMQNIKDLEDYIKKTNDTQLGMMIDMVEEYGKDLPTMIKKIKDKHVERDQAHIIFSTVHRCKGMEYDHVYLTDDFIKEEDLKNINKEVSQKSNFNEEINLLYVAITRAKQKLIIPKSLLPKEFPRSTQIEIIDEQRTPSKQTINLKNPPQKFNMEKFKMNKKCENSYEAWGKDAEQELISMYSRGTDVKILAKHFGRTSRAINSRLKKLGYESIE